MRPISLLYHDVVLPGNPDASGFSGGDAAIYKLDLAEFQRHLGSIQPAISKSTRPVRLTFDDGGASAHSLIAGLLEAFGWRGYFFVTTNWIGKNGFLNEHEIRDLRRRGHLIGSHSCSHPPRMSHGSYTEICREWKNSIARLSEILGEPVTLASVPGGYYTRKVGAAAAEAGIRTLFTSEPVTSSHSVNGCLVAGRYAIQRGTSAATAASMASGAIAPRCRQWVFWNMKKVAKSVGGNQWLRMRKWVLRGSEGLAARE